MTFAHFETLSGRPREAIALHERALQSLDATAGPRSRFSARTIEVLGLVFGTPSEQLRTFATTPGFMKTMGIPFAEAVSRIAYGQALLDAGELEKADEQLTQAETKGAMFGSVLDGILATPMVDLRKRQWRFDEVRQYYATALSTSMRPALFMRSPSAEIDLLSKLAEIDVLTGRVDQALAWNDWARTLARDSEPAREPWLLIGRGSLLQEAGRFRDAEKGYGEALVAAERLHDVHAIGAVHPELGLLHFYAGSYGKAAACIQKAIEIFQELKEGKVEPMWRALLADVHLMIGSHVSAAEAIARAKERANASGFSMAKARADFLKTVLEWRQGEPADVRGSFEALLAEDEAQRLSFSDEAKRFMADPISMNVGMTPPDPARISGDGVEVLQPARSLRGRNDRQ